MKTSEKPIVLVAGRNASSNLCMARSLGLAGYEVEVLRIIETRPKFANLMRLLEPEAHSKYVRKFHSCICGGDNGRIAQTLLSIAAPHGKMVLIPTCDMAASAADEYLQQLKDAFYLPNIGGKAGAINDLMRKDIQYELAKKAGLPVINTCVIRAKNGEFNIPDSVRYPCFIKPNISRNGLKSYMKRCDSEEELRGYLTAFSAGKEAEMLCQDYVDIGREYSILGLSAGGSVIGPGLFGADEGGHGGSKGVALTGSVVPCQQHRQLIDDILKFIGTLAFDGLFDVDLIETTDGHMYFVEMNMRYGASGWAITESGINLPAMYADYMVFHKSVDTDCRIRETGKKFVSEKVLLDEYARDLISMDQVRQFTDSADIHFIQNADDPKPYEHFRKFYLFGSVTRLLFQLKKSLKR